MYIYICIRVPYPPPNPTHSGLYGFSDFGHRDKTRDCGGASAS